MKNSNGVTAVAAEGHSNTTNGHGKSSEESKDSSRRRNGENGFEEWGGYMAAKKAKLDVQFNASTKGTSTSGFGMFNGLSIYINGYTDPPEPQLREMFILHGGTFHPYNSIKTNFVIATNLSVPSKNLYASKTVKPEWITESIAAGMKLDPRKFLLYNLNEEKNQLTLTQLIDKKTSAVSEISAINGSNGSSKSIELINVSNGDVLESSDEERHLQQNSTKVPQPTTPTRRKVKMANEDGFLEEFFKNSRLHLISDQKKEMLNKIGEMRKDISTHKFDNLFEFKKQIIDERNLIFSDDDNFLQNIDNETAILMHIDLDCFFVSVGLLSRPHLRGKPTAVTHSTGKEVNSKSDIASASYEARKFGIRNGMWVAAAKELCPSLEVIPYDFEEYRRISELFFDTVASITLDIEPCSIDEMVINATSVLQQVSGSTPETLADFIRKKIFEATKCPASVGIGSNRLLAKLATKKAKPNGVHYLKDTQAQSFIGDLEVGELPGIGYSHRSKLLEVLGVKTCKELLQVPTKDLKKCFGDKTAEKMLLSCQGKDTAELKYGFDRPKSISVDVNYGIRFTKDGQVTDFIIKLCHELATRASKAQALSSHLAVRVLVKQKGAGDPKKHGGHGLVDTVTKSSKFLQPTRDWQDMFKSATRLLKLMAVPAADYRGIGLSLTDLRFDFDKSSSEKKSIQRTLFDLTTSRGKQMVQFAMKVAGASKNDGEGVHSNGQVSSENGIANNSTKRQSSIEELINGDSENDVQPLKLTKKKMAVSVKVPSSDNGIQDKVDINVLRELPKDIAREMALHYGIDVADLDSDMDWLEGEELLRDAPPPLIEETVEHNDKSVSATEDTIEAVIRQSVAESSIKAVNPYENVDRIDPSFLSALPDSIRNEVLLQFQEAKGRKDENLIPPDEPQPCSSKQALERDRVWNDAITNKKPIQSSYKVPIGGLSDSDDGDDEILASNINLSCDERMCQEDEIIFPSTPPLMSTPSTGCQTSSPGKNGNGQGKFTPKSSKKRLDFGEEDEQITDWDGFWAKPLVADEPILPYEKVVLPSLNGVSEIEKVRNMIRDGLETIPEPLHEEIDCLKKYFADLISFGWLQQTRTLLTFIHRKSLKLDPESGWGKVLTEIIDATQKQCRQTFGYILCLD